MIKKFIEIKNIGKFKNFSAKGNIELNKLNVIYAENGRGKTTICDILRSLKTGEVDYIEGRKTLGCSDEPKVVIRLDNANYVYQNRAWDNTYPEIEIFDSTFVSENVYAGDFVEHNHKKNLYQIIVGSKGVGLAHEVELLDSEIRDKNRYIGEKKSEIEYLIGNEIALDSFLKLEKNNNIDEEIELKEKEKFALKKADELIRKDLLKKINIIEFPLEFSILMTKSIDGISKDTEALIKKHLHEKTKDATEDWVSLGISFVKDDLCPFCEQSLEGSNLFKAYKHYFSEEYNKLNIEISDMEENLKNLYNDTILYEIEHLINNNKSLCEFWNQFIEITEPIIDLERIMGSINEIKNIAQKYIEIKNRAILEIVKVKEDFEESKKNFENIQKYIDDYNISIEEINELVTSKKREIKSGDLSKVINALIILKAIKKRFDPEINKICENYINALETKRKLEEKKDEAKSKLDEYTEEIFTKYESNINQKLGMYNAGFRINDTKRRYIGGTASSSYQILINNIEVGLGDNNTPKNQPSFRNTLSSGDKSTLALAFFLAKLEQDPLIEQKIIILDDPFCSLDRSRRTWTKQLICKLSQQAKQVIVLSHDPKFLRLIWEDSNKNSIKALQFFRLGEKNTTITEWKIEEDTKSDYFKNYDVLMNYYNDNTGDKKDVVKTIRPLLEDYLKFKIPRQFLDNEWLGDMIKKIREADINSTLSNAKDILDELDGINDYSKKYHHGTNHNADIEIIDDSELQAYVRRTLNILGGF